MDADGNKNFTGVNFDAHNAVENYFLPDRIQEINDDLGAACDLCTITINSLIFTSSQRTNCSEDKCVIAAVNVIKDKIKNCQASFGVLSQKVIKQ